MSTGASNRELRDAGDDGSGGSLGDDFVRSLFATPNLDEIEALVQREAVSRYGLHHLRLHLNDELNRDGSTTTAGFAPEATIQGAPGVWQQRRLFELSGSLAKAAGLSVDWPMIDGQLAPEPPTWFNFIDLVAARLGTLQELQEQKLATEHLEESARLQSVLYTVANLSSAGLEMTQTLRRIHQVVGKLLYAPNFLIALYNRERDCVRFIYFVDEHDRGMIELDRDYPAADIGNSLTLAVIRHRCAALGSSSDLRRQFGLAPEASGYGRDSADWLGVPMIVDGEVRGAIVLQSYDQPDRYSPQDQALLEFVAQHILIALTRRQAYDELEQRVEERTRALSEQVRERRRGEKLQAALFGIADLASGELGMEDMLRRIHLLVDELMYARNFYIVLYDDQTDSMRFVYYADAKDPDFYQINHEVPADQMRNSLTLGLIRYGQPVHGPAEQVAEVLKVPSGIGFGTPALDWLGVPIAGSDGARGAVVVQTYEPDVHYSAEESTLLAYVAQHIMTALERKQSQSRLEALVEERTRKLASVIDELKQQICEREQAEKRLTHQTLHDALTGLPNRIYLHDMLEKALARFARDPAHRFAVLFLDLDRFKIINDSVGHVYGDNLLKQAAQRLVACTRDADVVARLGGDEFAILMEDLAAPEDACHMAKRAIETLSQPIQINGKELFTSVSIGITFSHPRYHKAEDLLRDADVAMYRAKARGRQRFDIFDEQLHQEALQLLELENDLRHAIANNEFEPHYQPLVHLADGRVVGFEALLRWHHPERGLMLPGDFLKVANDNGSIEQIDWQVFATICSHMADLRLDGCYVAVNIAPWRFRSPQLASRILDLLAAHNVPASNVRIEVTEDALLDNPEQVAATLNNLRQAGVLAALDDFGTGYSSLSYLHQYPLHTLKIDRSFVSQLRPDGTDNSSAVVRAILVLAATLGLEVIAEGIETEAQREALMALGCQYGQGFLFSKAQPVSAWNATSGTVYLPSEIASP